MTNKALFTKCYYAFALCISLLSGVSYAQVECTTGQSCTQNITLRPGWNSIFIQVKPVDGATETVFSDLLDGTGPQISSVWTWLAHRAKIDFVQDPDPENLLSQPGWLRFFSAASSKSFLNNLFAIQANRAYLVKLEGDAAITLTLTGIPVVPRIKWQPNSFNHLGFHVDPKNLPTFNDFFAGSPAHNNQPVYQLVNNSWKKVDPFSAVIQPDAAYWMFSKTGSDYTGPMDVDLPQLDRLQYGDVLTEFTAILKNLIDTTQSVSVQVLGNPTGMYYTNPDLAATEKWLPLTAPLTRDVNTVSESRLPLGIRRADFDLSSFNHTLQITSAAGSRWLIPVTASAPALNSLWIGSVTINNVSQVNNYQRNCIDTVTKKIYETYDANGKAVTLTYDEFDENMSTAGTGFDLCRDQNGAPTAGAVPADTSVKKGGEFSFRIIIHREGTQVRLLKDVIQMYDPAKPRFTPAGDPVLDADGNQLLGDYVLLTDDSLISNYDGVTIRDGEIVGRRISSVAYDFPGKTLDMTGSLDGTLSATLVLASDATTNPFRHYYHNDHKNTGYQIERIISFENVDLPAESGLQVDPLGKGREVIDGNYTETITGLNNDPIVVKGTYILRHAVAVKTLNQ